MGIEGYSSADDRDSGTRCCLTGNRDIRILDFDLLLLEIDDSTDFEDDDSRTLGFKGFSERSLSIGVEIGNLDDSSTGSISIEVAEVVNLLGDDVASDGTVSLTNTEKAQELSVESTEEGYLSVGTAGKKSRIGIETETASDEAKILPGYDSQVQFDNLHQGDEEDENKDDEEEEKEENERESEAAITYNDVA